MELIIGRLGDLKLPSSDKTASRRHAVLRTLSGDRYEIEGIEDRTFLVNGVSFNKKQVGPDTPLRFGSTETTVRKLLAAWQNDRKADEWHGNGGNEKPQGSEDVSAAFDALECVWKDYNKQKSALQLSVSKLNNVRMMVLPVGSLISIVVSMLAANDMAMKLVGTVIGVLFTIGVSIVIGRLSMSRQKQVHEDTEELTAKFMLTYVCPNPKCKHYLGNVPFKVLKAQGACPYCKAKFK